MNHRTDRHHRIAADLTAADDEEVERRLAAARPLGHGIGGQTLLMRVAGEPVFVKRVPLTDLEREPRHVRSTANVFGLPTYYQYGVGSTGFGAWRELAAHEATTGWVLEGRTRIFPLLHHWRVLPAVPSGKPMHNHYDGHPAVQRRLEAIAAATASIVLFCEYVPENLDSWLTRHEHGTAYAARELTAGAAFMRANGMIHFDAHPGNVLVAADGLCFADLGLAVLDSFDLSAGERAFFELHRDWDSYDVRRYLAGWMRHHGRPEPPGYGPVTDVLSDFYDRLVAGPKTHPYPVAELVRAARESEPERSRSPR